MRDLSQPPEWAEALLRLVLQPRDFECVSGDLLEEYRQSVRPVRGRQRADLWYVGQVFGLVWRNARLWAALFAAAYVARTALDWRLPTTEFHARAAASTFLGIGLLLVAGFWAAYRSRSFAAGPLIGLAIAAMAAPMALLGVLMLFGLWHDPASLAAIRASGGLEEVFTLPVALMLPGIVVGTIGGLLGAAASKLRSV
jgi:hypothetical protein